MELEGSLPYTQERATRSCLGLGESCVHILTPFLMLSFHQRLCLPSGPFPPGFPIRMLYAFVVSFTRAKCLTHLTLLSLNTQIWRPQLMEELHVMFLPKICSAIWETIVIRAGYLTSLGSWTRRHAVFVTLAICFECLLFLCALSSSASLLSRSIWSVFTQHKKETFCTMYRNERRNKSDCSNDNDGSLCLIFFISVFTLKSCAIHVRVHMPYVLCVLLPEK
jgi:hypothetical protein